MAFGLIHSNYFGPNALIIEEVGAITTDLYGLSTCTLTAKGPPNSFGLVPPLFSSHPFFTYLNVERQRVSILKDGFMWVTLEYAGIAGATEPIYELCLGLGEEPIQTHPKFVSEIAGRPSAPLHGAFFIDPETGNKTEDDSIGVFEKFVNIVGGVQNPFAGIESYLDFSQAVWRKRFYQTSQPTDISFLGHKLFPEGPVPSLPGQRFWIYQSLNFERRGNVYGVTKEWKASARNALTTDASDIIYGGSG